MLETVLKRFEEPDEVRTFEKGKFEILRVGGMTIGTGFTLFIVPSLYVLLAKDHQRARARAAAEEGRAPDEPLPQPT